MPTGATAPSQLHTFAMFYLVPLLTAGVSIVYFLSQPRVSAPLTTRLLTSAHGFSIALLYVGLWVLAGTPAPADPRSYLPLFLLLLVPLALMVASLGWYKGRRLIHLLQLVNLACLSVLGFFAFFVFGGT
jgi:hypothetical protein